MKFLKKLFKYCVISFLFYFGIKMYRRIKSVMKMSHSLPLFLKNTVGESPQIDIRYTIRALVIKIGFNQETIDREKDLEGMIQEYIDDFYPALSSLNTTITIYTRSAEEKEEVQSEDSGENTPVEEAVQEEQEGEKDGDGENNEESDKEES